MKNLARVGGLVFAIAMVGAACAENKEEPRGRHGPPGIRGQFGPAGGPPGGFGHQGPPGVRRGGGGGFGGGGFGGGGRLGGLPGHPPGPPPGMGADVWKRPEVQKRLGLTEEQIKKLEEVSFELETRRIEIQAQSEIARLNLERLLEREEIDRKAIEEQIYNIGNLHAETLRGMAEQKIAFRKILTEEQREQIQEFLSRFREGRGRENATERRREGLGEHRDRVRDELRKSRDQRRERPEKADKPEVKKDKKDRGKNDKKGRSGKKGEGKKKQESRAPDADGSEETETAKEKLTDLGESLEAMVDSKSE